MLHNPKWDLMSLESLIAWLETQPVDGAYDYDHCERCLIGRYLTDRVGGIEAHRGVYTDMPHYREIAANEPYTFGAALERAYAAQES